MRWEFFVAPRHPWKFCGWPRRVTGLGGRGAPLKVAHTFTTCEDIWGTSCWHCRAWTFFLDKFLGLKQRCDTLSWFSHSRWIFIFYLFFRLILMLGMPQGISFSSLFQALCKACNPAGNFFFISFSGPFWSVECWALTQTCVYTWWASWIMFVKSCIFRENGGNFGFFRWIMAEISDFFSAAVQTSGLPSSPAKEKGFSSASAMALAMF